MPRVLSFACIAALMFAAQTARAEVHFGRNVFIGGHNVSHQTFNRHRRGEFYLYRNKPRHAGCVWRSNGDGSRTKICRFQTLR
jgi:hypothetical protein